MNENKLLNKGTVFAIIILFAGASIVPSVNANIQNTSNTETIYYFKSQASASSCITETIENSNNDKNLNRDQIDQQQPLWNGNLFGTIAPNMMAQSFIPSMNILTQVAVLLKKKGDPPGEFCVSIRDVLNGSDIVSACVLSSDISANGDWVEFDFPDINVTPGNTYYIIYIPDEGCNKDNLIGWGCYPDDPYPIGEQWFYDGDYDCWNEIAWNEDFCFITYGLNTPLTELEIDRVSGSFGKIRMEIKNVGEEEATSVQWSIEIQGVIIIPGHNQWSGTISNIPAGESVNVCTDGLILGLGSYEIIISTGASNAEDVAKTANGFILLFFVIISTR